MYFHDTKRSDENNKCTQSEHIIRLLELCLLLCKGPWCVIGLAHFHDKQREASSWQSGIINNTSSQDLVRSLKDGVHWELT